ncbi:Reticuline oxidase-like protein [Hibiscus syriacus]|uniref:Reticuline oxidase-like protein n=1 Tax=Hibiscus syriacus TaxID=106335 RepID=A0A6A2Z7D2_HIBSY|nr:berberine bridge enzyme-like 21 [Hibiscus syriacus]KAE8687025.1 Reticuline oxidase-like protein [Hibiscus syriacus]
MSILILLVLSLVSFNSALTSTTSDSVYQTLLRCLNEYNPSHNASAIVFSKSNPSYTSVLRAYMRNARFRTSSTPKPAIIITPLEESHVSAAVICCQMVGFHLKVRGGGHDYEGLSYVSNEPFFILDMFNLRSVSIDIENESAWVQAGATLGELYYNIWKRSNVHGFSGGVCPTVGVAGHISGAGFGNLLRKYGVSSDLVVDAKIVDVDGKILDRKAMREDLFWAIRGGGAASFGVVLAYKVKLVLVPETVTVFKVERFLKDNATDIALKWQSIAPTTDKNLFMRMILQPSTLNNRTTLRVKIKALYLGDANSVVAMLGKEFPELKLTKEQCIEMRWIDSVLWWANLDVRTSPTKLLDREIGRTGFLKMKSDYVETPIPRDGLELLWKKIIELGHVGMSCQPYGGIMNEIKATDTAFPHRAGNLYKIQYAVNWDVPGDEDEWDEPRKEADMDYTSRANRLHKFMTQLVSKNPRRAYLSYRDMDIGTTKHWSYEEGKVYGKSYFNGNYERLVDVKTAVDPKNFFRNEQSVPPRSTK